MLSDAFDSFTYAFRPSLLVLYLVVLVGQFLRWLSGQLPFPARNTLVRDLLGVPLELGGVVLVAGGVVGVLHYVVSDVAGRSTEQ